MATSLRKNSAYYAVTTKVTVPATSTKTGTITTAGKNVVGVGTKFTTEIKKGDWIADLVTNNELRVVTDVRDDLFLTIDSAFTADIAGATLTVVRSRAKQVSLANAGGAAATIDGVTFAVGESVTYPKSNKNPDGKDFIDPLLVNGTGTTIKVQIQK
jgi:hypothetical protein